MLTALFPTQSTTQKTTQKSGGLLKPLDFSTISNQPTEQKVPTPITPKVGFWDVIKGLPAAAAKVGGEVYNAVAGMAVPSATPQELRTPSLLSDTLTGLPKAAQTVGRELVKPEGIGQALLGTARGISDSVTDIIINNFVPKTDREGTRIEVQKVLDKYIAPQEGNLMKGFQVGGSAAPIIAGGAAGAGLAGPVGAVVGFMGVGQASLPRESDIETRAVQAVKDLSILGLFHLGSKAAESAKAYIKGGIEETYKIPVQGEVTPEVKIPINVEGKLKPLFTEMVKPKPLKLSAKDEFKVGDVLDPQGKTNMMGKVTIKEIIGNTLKFTDAEGTDFAGMARATVRTLVKEGSWKKIEQPIVSETKTPQPFAQEAIPKELQPLVELAQKTGSEEKFWNVIDKAINNKYEISKGTPTEIKKLGLRISNPEEAIKINGTEIPLKEIDKYFSQESKKIGKSFGYDNFYNQATKGAEVKPIVPEPIKSPIIEMNIGINPGIDKFISEDIKPAAKGIIGGVQKTWDLIKKTLAPATRGEAAQKTASIVRESLGRMARTKETTYQTLAKSRTIFDRYTKEQSLDFIDKLEQGKPIKDAEQFTSTMREALDTRWKQIQDIKGTQAYIENYFPHIWKDPEKATQVLQGFGKRPFEGTKGYMKQRTIPTTKEGVALGLEPSSYNPVELIMARVSDMDRFLMANDVWTKFKQQGLNKFVRPGGDVPTNWIKVNDNISTKFYKPTIKEYFDEQVMTKLNDLADSLGITHERVQALGGRLMGKSLTGQNLVKTRFATPEPVLLHEIGHQLDDRFNIQSDFINKPILKQEIRKLVDLKYENKEVSNYFKTYVRKGEEKVAAMFEAYLQTPERFKEVAPNTYKAFESFLASNPETKPILDIKPSMVFGSREQELHILAKAGDWYMPEQAATIVNNYLSPGLTNNPIYNAFRMGGNFLNQVQLGLSGFHALFTSSDAVISKGALELQKFTPTSIAKTIASPISAPYYLWKNLIRGNALLKDYFSKNPEVPALVDALEKAGGRVKMDRFYLNNATDNFMKALRGGNLVGAFVRTPGAIIETLAKPLMQELVPRQKLGIFADAATEILKQSEKENWSEYKTTLRLQELWDSVDNRMGQLVYDNLFWNKVLKDMGMAATRSLGWNLGTIRELGGGAKDIAKIPIQLLTKTGRANIRITPKMAYTMTLPYVAGVWGAIIYYMYNGTAPQTLLDYYYPKTGKKKTDGTDERITLPSYMKDVFAYQREGLQTILNKVHPELSAIIDMLQNKDYYGTEIRNPNDSLVKQVKDLFDYQAQQFVPFSITNMQQRAKTGSSWSAYLQSFIGITPAPGYITRTPLQTEISNLYDLRFGGGVQTKEQRADSQTKTDIRTLYLLGKKDEANQKLQEAVKQGVIKPDGVSQFIKEADIPSDIKLFKQLPESDQEALVKKMDLYQLSRYAWYVNKDLKAKLSTISDNTKNWVELFKQGEVKEPKWVKGQLSE